MDLSSEQLATLRRMLGIDDPYMGKPIPCRNYAAVQPGNAHYKELERLGAIQKRAKVMPGSEIDLWEVTPSGIVEAALSHKKIQKTKAARRYHAYLKISDIYYSDLTFGEFLSHPFFKQTRDEA